MKLSEVIAALEDGKKVECSSYGNANWVPYEVGLSVFLQYESTQYEAKHWRIAPEPVRELVPWDIGPQHLGVKVRARGTLSASRFSVINSIDDGKFYLLGFGKLTPEQLMRDWEQINDGQPCGKWVTK